jgi:hypothetical protein
MLRTGAEFACRIISGDALFPQNVTLLGLGMWAASAEAAGVLLPRAAYGDAWLELANKLHAYRCFAEAATGMPCADGLAGAIRRLDGMDAWHRAWATEGVGYRWALSVMSQETPGSPLFAVALPRRVVIPLHTGAGLALAVEALRDAARSGSRAVAAGFWKECRQRSLEGYAEAMFEALGLVTITMYPHMAMQIDRELDDAPQNLADYFWHGVGRGSYFSPFGFIPIPAACRAAADRSHRLPKSARGRSNLLAGLAWATTLVNIRDPRVLEARARELAQWIGADGSFANGVASALIVWREIAPDDGSADALEAYRPANSAPHLWERSFEEPAALARKAYPAVRSTGQLGATFRARLLDFAVGG